MTPNRDMLRSIHDELDSFDVQSWLLIAVAAVPYALGWFVGFIVRLALWLVAAMVAGFKAGRGIGEE